MSRGASQREPPALTAAGKVAEAADEMSPANLDFLASPAAAERSLMAALPTSLAGHRMDLLIMR